MMNQETDRKSLREHLETVQSAIDFLESENKSLKDELKKKAKCAPCIHSSDRRMASTWQNRYGSEDQFTTEQYEKVGVAIELNPDVGGPENKVTKEYLTGVPKQ